MSSSRRGRVPHSDRAIVDHLRDAYGLLGSTSCASYDSYRSTHPSAPTRMAVIARYGSWLEALSAAGLEPSPRSGQGRALGAVSIPDERVFQMLGMCAEIVGRAPSVREYDSWRADIRTMGVDPPSSAIVRRRFGGWLSALEAASSTSSPERVLA